jgi:septum formation protein
MKLVLASKSPRRHELISKLGLPVEIRIKEVDEIYPDSLPVKEVPEYLARLKAEPFIDSLKHDELLVTSDTVVIKDGNLIGKPANKEDSIRMLKGLSSSDHSVYTGVSLASSEKQISFTTSTNVFFSEITDDEIRYYVNEFKPFDKAGSYGIQEWIGYIGVHKIEGCYYNVMGLPLHDLYHAIKKDFGSILNNERQF